MKIPERIASIRPFHVMELLARAKAMERSGRNIVHMEIGEPDFPTPKAVIEAGIQALQSGAIHYTAAAGLPELREAIADHYRRHYGIDVAPERVFVTPGASGAFILVLSALIEAGDEVLLADPGYPCYANLVRVFGGVPHGIPVTAKTRFHLDAGAVDHDWSPATVGAILASPANPTGTLIEPETFRALIVAMAARGGFLVSDEIYHGLEYDCRSRTALEFSQDVFVVNSFSKYFGMTGWRLGWAIVPQALAETFERLAQNLFISAPTHSQLAALAAFTPGNLEELEHRRQEFLARRDFLVSALEELEFGIPSPPQGAFYIYADSTRHSSDSFQLAGQALEQAGVAMTPGCDFGDYRARDFVRFSYTASMERLAEGVARLNSFLARRRGTR